MEECKLLISKYKENCRNLFLNMRRRFKDDALQDSASDLERMWSVKAVSKKHKDLYNFGIKLERKHNTWMH